MTINRFSCAGPAASVIVPVHSGGYREEGSHVTPNNDTTCPGGSRPLTTGQSGGAVPGFPIDTAGTGRSAIEMHQPGVSTGCIVFDDTTDWNTVKDLINKGNNGKSNCVHGGPPSPIPISITYTPAVTPVGNEPG